MDKLVTIRLELTCKDAFVKLYTTSMNNFNILGRWIASLNRPFVYIY